MKKISVTKWNEVYRNTDSETVTDWHGLELHVKRVISYPEMSQLVREVTGVCFDENGDYRPENMDFAFRASVVMRYSNLTVPDDGEKAYLLLYGTDAYETVSANADDSQLNAVKSAIEDRIVYLVDTRTKQFASAIEEIRSSVADAVKTIRETADSVGGFDADQVKSFMEVIAGAGELDEAKIVDALAEKGLLNVE